MKKQWWHDKVAYQIYPKSFRDTNGDGIGDLRGIIEKLDYLKELGVDIVWISPCYCSPMADQGYDISDYYNIDPRFGTMEDMDELLAEAKKRDMHILMDLVVNHCSDEHEWFQKAKEDPEGKYGKYFYLEKCEDGKLPCNWRSYFGGTVWEPLEGTDYHYLHVFHKKQPDLNWENPEVREEIYKMINWWLDKGLAGFRIDAIINIKKSLPWKDYPVDREDGLSFVINMLKDAKGVLDFLNELADRTFRPHQALTVGELFNEKPEELAGYIGEDGCFSSIFDFEKTIFGGSEKGWYANTPITLEDVKACTFKSQRKVEGIGFMSNIIENHDEPRGVSRYIPEEDLSETSKKMLAIFYFFLKGLPFIYQGQELGMENMKFTSIDQVDDISTLDQYKTAREAGLSEEEALKAVNVYSRDNARTPFHWDDSAHAGFTTGTPWLGVNPNFTRINAAAQEENPESMLNFYRTLTRIRKAPEYKDTFVYGVCEPVWEEEKNLLAYYRRGEGQDILVICNGQKEERSISFNETIKNIILNNMDVLETDDGRITLKGYQAVVLEV